MSHSTATQLVRNANRSTFSAVTRGFASTMASVVFIGAILLYVASFLQVRLASFGVDSATGLPMTRAEFLVLLMQSPGFLFQQWTGGAWSRVGVLDRLPVLAGAALWLVACWAPGRCLLRAIQVDRKMSTCELGVYSFAVGLSVLSLSTLAIGLCGALHVPALIVVAPVACWAFEIVWRLRQRRANCNTRPTRSSTSTMPSRPMRWQWAVCAPFALLLVLSALLPPWAFDARCYHLQAPKEFAASGFIGFVPHNVYANMPLGAEMHALAAMVLWPGADGWWFGALVGKVVIAACTILTSVGLYASASRFASPRAGAIAAVTYISIPWILYVSTTGLIDGVVAMYFALALLAALRWATAAGDTSLSWPALSGVLAGSAVACKYPAVLFVAVPLLLFVCAIAFHRTRRQTSRGTLRETARAGLVFVVAATASCGLWLAKNAVLTGNPTYPLLYDVFGGETRTEAKEDQWSRVHSPPRDDFGRTHSIGQAVESAVRVLWSSNWLSPLVWPLCAAGLWLARDRRMAWGLGASIVAYFALWWLLTHRIDRFWLPVLPAAALLAGLGAASVRTSSLRICVPALLLFGLVANLLTVSSRAIGDNRLLVAYEQLRIDVPDARDGLFTRTNPGHVLLNQIMTADDTVLLAGDSRPFDLEGKVLYNTAFDDCVFEKLLRGKSRTERLDSLRDVGVTYVFVHWTGIAEELSAEGYGFTDLVTPELVHQELVVEQRILEPLGFAAGGGELFRVTSASLGLAQ